MYTLYFPYIYKIKIKSDEIFDYVYHEGNVMIELYKTEYVFNDLVEKENLNYEYEYECNDIMRGLLALKFESKIEMVKFILKYS
jgi:hypothetical protein